ncbi:hypothetical protein J4729_07405 [Leisingera sp. HS039]|uniref:hypothetical protein n=1 Tax=Leisingera sp. HS039 TaxID=2818496 RepID=UPI001B3A5EB9|nr:hypothetical protein [Leisingera sp. HS039]MBQ4824375.1 hypothetical protein [Leisingera sp. HS039]
MDAQAKMARSVDGTIDGLRALQIAGGYAGASVEQVNGAVQQMGKRLAEAAREGKGPAADALKLLGLNAKALMDLDVDQRVGAIAERMNEMGLSAQDASGILRDLGVRSNEMALVMLQGSDAIRSARDEVQKFGISLSEDAAAGVESANDALSKISFVMEGLRNQLAVGLAPILQQLALDFQNASVAGGPLQTSVTALVAAFSDLATAILNPAFVEAAALFGSTIARGIALAADASIALAENAELAGVAMIALGGAMAFFSGPIGLAIAAVSGGVFLLSTRLGDAETAAYDASEAERQLSVALDGLDTSSGKAVDAAVALTGKHIEQADAALRAAEAEYALARAQAESALATAQMKEGAHFTQLVGLPEEIENAKQDLADLDQYYQEKIDSLAAHKTRLGQSLQGVYQGKFPGRGERGGALGEGEGGGGTDPLAADKSREALERLLGVIDPAAAKAKRLAEGMAVLNTALKKGVIDQDEYNLRVDQLNKSLGETPEKSGAASSSLSELLKRLQEGGDAAGTMSDDVNSAIGSLIDRIDSGTDALRQFAVELVKIFAVRGISKILGGDDWLSAPLIGKNALGTDNWRGGLSWVGERGPEVVNLPRGAQVIPNNRLEGAFGGGGGGFTYAPTIDAKGASLAAVQELEGRMAQDAVRFNAKVLQAVQLGQKGRKLR